MSSPFLDDQDAPQSRQLGPGVKDSSESHQTQP